MDEKFCVEVRRNMENRVDGIENRTNAKITVIESCVNRLEELLTEQQKIHSRILYILEQHDAKLKEHDKFIEDSKEKPAQKLDNVVRVITNVGQGVLVAWLIYVLTTTYGG